MKRNLWWAMFVLTIFFGVAMAQLPTFPPVTGKYVVYVARCLDGDTVEVYWCTSAVARLDGLNAPEVHGVQKEEGLKAKARLEYLCPPGFYTAEFKGREKYGRHLVVIQNKLGGSVNDDLIKSGLVKAWDGKGPRP